jgi:hypothetical protein
MKSLLDSLQSQWSAMSKRERNLALATVVCVLAFAGWSIVTSAQAKLTALQQDVDRLQEQVVNATAQIARKQQVEARYAEVAAQHSSAWDKYEVYERLRQEIFRLAQKVPPALDENGVPVRSNSESGALVNIPELRQGTMTETEEGYREYKISFRVPNVELADLFNFLERLQQSPQSLRIDGLAFARDWDSTIVTADIDLTRIIVDAASAGAVDTGETTEFAALELDPTKWTAESGALQASGAGLTLEAQEEGAALYLEQPLPGAASYDCIIELTSTGRGMLAVATGSDGVPMPGAERLPSDGAPYRVHLQFTVPGKRGEAVMMRVPFITLNDLGAQLEVRGISLRKAES